jgi:ADP-ribosylglycohydrolase
MLFDAEWRAKMIADEIKQLAETGHAVEELRACLGATRGEMSVAQYEAFWTLLEGLPAPSDFPYQEPDGLQAIRALRPDGPRRMSIASSDLADRMLGAWLGRCAGCLVGKPCEGWSRERIEAYLRAGDAYPLAGYFPFIEAVADQVAHRPRSTMAGRIDEMARDDDTDYTVLGMHIVETNGRDFATESVARAWLELLPYMKTYTAERVAYHNLLQGHAPPSSASWRNPYREWIGAQIRADGFGYVNPGNPELAAEYGWRDARLSHVKNGIYGEMWAAAMIAASFATDDPLEAIRIGLTEIPTTCRLAEALNDAIEVAGRLPSWQAAWDELMARYGAYHGVHTINNAVIVVLGLLYGGGDFGRTLSISVMCGLDTDCNGATAGSVIGAILGARALPADYVDPLKDTLRSAVFGYDGSAISELAERTLALVKAG